MINEYKDHTCWKVAGEQVAPDVQNWIYPSSHPVAETLGIHQKATKVVAEKVIPPQK